MDDQLTMTCLTTLIMNEAYYGEYDHNKMPSTNLSGTAHVIDMYEHLYNVIIRDLCCRTTSVKCGCQLGYRRGNTPYI